MFMADLMGLVIPGAFLPKTSSLRIVDMRFTGQLPRLGGYGQAFQEMGYQKWGEKCKTT